MHAWSTHESTIACLAIIFWFRACAPAAHCDLAHAGALAAHTPPAGANPFYAQLTFSNFADPIVNVTIKGQLLEPMDWHMCLPRGCRPA